MVLVADCGALPPGMKDALAQAQAHFSSYLANTVGISAQVQLGTVPTIGYVSAEEARIFENTRLNKITDGDNDVAKIKKLQDELVAKDAYIVELETRLGARPATT
jgi:hypothetical protein